MNELNVIRWRVPSSVPDGNRKMRMYANTLKGLLKADFMRCLNGWKFSLEDIENLLSEMLDCPRYAINGQQMKWLEEYKESLSVAPDAKVERSYSGGLLDLFHNNTYLIEELVCLSDDEIARKIKGWAKEKDKLGKPLIENPENGLKTRFAKELKANGIIKQSEKTFRIKL